MNWKTILWPGFMRRLDHYLLVSHPKIWSTRVHSFSFYILIVGLFIVFLGFIGISVKASNLPNVDEVQNIQTALTLFLGVSILILLFYQQRFSVRNFSLIKLNAGLIPLFFLFLSGYLFMNLYQNRVLSSVPEEVVEAQLERYYKVFNRNAAVTIGDSSLTSEAVIFSKTPGFYIDVEKGIKVDTAKVELDKDKFNSRAYFFMAEDEEDLNFFDEYLKMYQPGRDIFPDVEFLNFLATKVRYNYEGTTPVKVEKLVSMMEEEKKENYPWRKTNVREDQNWYFDKELSNDKDALFPQIFSYNYDFYYTSSHKTVAEPLNTLSTLKQGDNLERFSFLLLFSFPFIAVLMFLLTIGRLEQVIISIVTLSGIGFILSSVGEESVFYAGIIAGFILIPLVMLFIPRDKPLYQVLLVLIAIALPIFLVALTYFSEEYFYEDPFGFHTTRVNTPGLIAYVLTSMILINAFLYLMFVRKQYTPKRV